MSKNSKESEFSKKVLNFVEAIILLTLCIVMAAVFMGNVSDLDAVVTGVFSLSSIAFGFYFWKAKNENIRKYGQNITEEEAKKIGQMYNQIFKGGK